MIEIGSTEPQSGVFQKDISKNQDISLKYLDHIIHSLKIAGLISNVKGKKSGYILTRPASEITVLDIHNAFEHGVCVVDCLERNITCERESTCEVQGFWGDLNNMIRDYLNDITLEELILKEVHVGQGRVI